MINNGTLIIISYGGALLLGATIGKTISTLIRRYYE